MKPDSVLVTFKPSHLVDSQIIIQFIDCIYSRLFSSEMIDKTIDICIIRFPSFHHNLWNEVHSFCNQMDPVGSISSVYRKHPIENYCLISKTNVCDGRFLFSYLTLEKETGVISFNLQDTSNDSRQGVVIIDRSQLSDSQAEIILEEYCVKNYLLFGLNDNYLYWRLSTFSASAEKVKKISPGETNILVLCKVEKDQKSSSTCLVLTDYQTQPAPVTSFVENKV